MASITHPNLATIHDATSWRGTPLLVLELLEGGTLTDRLGSGPLPVGDAVELGITLAGVLQRTHSTGVLHRDVKPSNIGYTGDGIPKLLDFGLALRWPRFVDSLAACLRCIPVAAHLARISLDRSSCRRCCACG